MFGMQVNFQGTHHPVEFDSVLSERVVGGNVEPLGVDLVDGVDVFPGAPHVGVVLVAGDARLHSLWWQLHCACVPQRANLTRDPSHQL